MKIYLETKNELLLLFYILQINFRSVLFFTKNICQLYEKSFYFFSFLQKSSNAIAKIPTIMLSISYRGVKFIDAKSKVGC
jgi:hypothetical protein